MKSVWYYKLSFKKPFIMSNVQFEGDNFSGASGFSSPSSSPVNTGYGGLNNFSDNSPVIGGPKMVRWLVKVGIARTEKQALYTLVGVCILCILVAIILITTAGSSNQRKAEQIQKILLDSSNTI